MHLKFWGSFVSRRLNRFLFNCFGAKTDEINTLFGRHGLSELKEIAKGHYASVGSVASRTPPNREGTCSDDPQRAGRWEDLKSAGQNRPPVDKNENEAGKKARRDPYSDPSSTGHQTECKQLERSLDNGDTKVARSSGWQPPEPAGGNPSVDAGAGGAAVLGAQTQADLVVPLEWNRSAKDGVSRGTQKVVQQNWAMPELTAPVSQESYPKAEKEVAKTKRSTQGEGEATMPAVEQVSQIPEDGASVSGSADPAEAGRQGADSREGLQSSANAAESTLGGVKGSSVPMKATGAPGGSGSKPNLISTPETKAVAVETGAAKAGPCLICSDGAIIQRRTWPPRMGSQDTESEQDKIFNHPERFGSAKKVEENCREITILRHPTRLTKDEKAFSLECLRVTPPAVNKHDFRPINAAMMLRCPIGGGTRRFGILNPKSLRNSIQTHFNLHHRSVPQNAFELKIESNRAGYIYITYPVAVGPAHVQEEGVSHLERSQGQGRRKGGRKGGKGHPKERAKHGQTAWKGAKS